MVATAKPLIEPNAQNQYEVTAEDLPLCCPMPQMYLWNSHPRVYLPIQETGAGQVSLLRRRVHAAALNAGAPRCFSGTACRTFPRPAASPGAG